MGKEKDELLVLDANMIITGNLDVRGKLTAKGSSVGNGGAATPAQILKIFKGWNTHFRCEAGWSGELCNQAAKCSSGSPSNCKLQHVKAPGYSAGTVFKVTGGRRIRRSTDKDSCPAGFKLWSPRNKNDWTIIFNAMGKNIKNYPRKPHLLIDITKSSNGNNAAGRNYVMKSSVAQQKPWKTKDDSAWWLRDAKYNEPNGDYHANCYLHIYDVNPNNVRFNDGNCNYYSTEYMCQPKQTLKCGSGSPGNCKASAISASGYSAGRIVRIDNGRPVRRSGDKHSCPPGMKIWSPRNKNDWTIVFNAMGKNINNYPKKPHLIVDVTRPANGCGGCTKYAMKSNVAQQASWKTTDGSAWWLRDAKYNEPNGDYHANCYLHVYDVNPNNVRFNDGNCNYY